MPFMQAHQENSKTRAYTILAMESYHPASETVAASSAAAYKDHRIHLGVPEEPALI